MILLISFTESDIFSIFILYSTLDLLNWTSKQISYFSCVRLIFTVQVLVLRYKFGHLFFKCNTSKFDLFNKMKLYVKATGL